MERDGEPASTRPRCANCLSPCSAGIAAGRAAFMFSSSGQDWPYSQMREADLGMTTQELLADDAVATAVSLTAQMFWLPQGTVAAIVTVGLPALSRLAAVNPLLVARLYMVSREPLPAPIDQFYASMAKSPVVRQAIMDDYRATYGEMLDPVNRAVGRQVGTTDGQAREVLAALLPAICQVLGRTNTGGTAEFAQRLLKLGSKGLPQAGSGPEGAP